MDSLANQAKHRHLTLKTLRTTKSNDTLRLETLYWLSRHYSRWQRRQDSCLYFAHLLVQNAKQLNNRKYEIYGLLQFENYYHNIVRNNIKALKYNLVVASLFSKYTPETEIIQVVERNLGSLYSQAGDYDMALLHLNKVKDQLDSQIVTLRKQHVSNTSTFSKTFSKTIGNLIDVEQKIAVLYMRKEDFTECEKHYKAALELLPESNLPLNNAYVYGDLAEFYLKIENYKNALEYAKLAEPIWLRYNSAGNAHNMAMLACAYAGTGHPEQAQYYAHKVLALNNIANSARLITYRALYLMAEYKQDWQTSLGCVFDCMISYICR